MMKWHKSLIFQITYRKCKNHMPPLCADGENSDPGSISAFLSQRSASEQPRKTRISTDLFLHAQELYTGPLHAIAIKKTGSGKQ